MCPGAFSCPLPSSRWLVEQMCPSLPFLKGSVGGKCRALLCPRGTSCSLQPQPAARGTGGHSGLSQDRVALGWHTLVQFPALCPIHRGSAKAEGR